MTDPIICFLPCRQGSERIPRKNIKPLAHFENGLLEVKLRQLLATEEIDRIVLSTNDEEILQYAALFETERLVLHRRDNALGSSKTSTDQLVGHALELIGVGHILWTHVTSPFVTSKIYAEVIREYRTAINAGYDSLMTTTPIHGFLWSEDGPINYDRNLEKWPRTQSLKPIHEVNSAVFLAHSDIYDRLGDRIGVRPFLFPIDQLIAHDIDWPEDFLIAEQFVHAGLVET